jgi:hypothetical protein
LHPSEELQATRHSPKTTVYLIPTACSVKWVMLTFCFVDLAYFIIILACNFIPLLLLLQQQVVGSVVG